MEGWGLVYDRYIVWLNLGGGGCDMGIGVHGGANKCLCPERIIAGSPRNNEKERERKSWL